MARFALLSACLITALALGASTALAHPATERYIPIGKSPGVSQTATIGVIEAVNVADRSIRVGGRDAAHWVRLTDRTRIWLDRTDLAKNNLIGGFRNCQVGRTVEVRYEDPGSRAVAAWIKIAVPAAGTPDADVRSR
jgi:hypothetical protein